MHDWQTVTSTLEFPYRRSLGAVVGGFAEALRDKRIVGSVTTEGRVLVPPLEFDPDTGDAVRPDLVEVGPGGVVTTPPGPTSTRSAWTASPESGSNSNGGTSTRPSVVTEPTMRFSRSASANPPTTAPRERR